MAILYGHGGSADHGEEDRVRGTCRLLSCRPAVYSFGLEEDWHYGLAECADLWRMPRQLREPVLALHPRARTGKVLWCWTGVPGSRDLRQFETVVVPDETSRARLCQAGLGKKVRLGPDPVFLVQRRIRPLEGAFRSDTVGLCLSAGVGRYEKRTGLIYESYRRLIRFLLDETTWQLALIPYCVKKGRDDRVLHGLLYREFEDTGRLVLRADDQSPCLRGDISLCRCVIGSVGAVAAWSCGVPALCIGADPHAVGLARTLFGTWQGAVLPAAWLQEPGDLLGAAAEFLRYEEQQRRMLEVGVFRQRQRSLSWDWAKMALAE